VDKEQKLGCKYTSHRDMKVNVDHYVFDIKRMFKEAHEKLEGMFTDEVLLHIVTYSGVLFTMELYCTPKVNTLQLNTASNSSNTRRRPTRMVSEHSLL
jgi:hypothetical protein